MFLKIKYYPYSLSPKLFLLIILFILINSRILINLILMAKIPHILISLAKLILIESFLDISMSKCFSSKHWSKFITDPIEKLTNRSWITDKSGWRFYVRLWRLTYCIFYIVWNPLYKIWRVFTRCNTIVINLTWWNFSSECYRTC